MCIEFFLLKYGWEETGLYSFCLSWSLDKAVFMYQANDYHWLLDTCVTRIPQGEHQTCRFLGFALRYADSVSLDAGPWNVHLSRSSGYSYTE